MPCRPRSKYQLKFGIVSFRNAILARRTGNLLQWPTAGEISVDFEMLKNFKLQHSETPETILPSFQIYIKLGN